MNSPILILTLAGSSVAATVQHEVVVRDHLAELSTERVVTARLGDTTAGSWAGTFGGARGLPTPVVPVDPPYTGMRQRLQTTDAAPGWPGRLAIRLDRLGYDGVQYPRCSGILVGPKWVLSAAHCLVRPTSISGIQEEWYADSFFVRPAFDRGRDYPGLAPVRVVRTMVSKTVFQALSSYAGDNDWALLELASDLGTSLGWAQVYPMEDRREGKNIHMLGYPIIPEACRTGVPCDTASRKDTLCHSWGPVERLHQGAGIPKDWVPRVRAWQGESGSPVLDCPQDACDPGPVRTRGTRWTIEAINAFDSTMSGVLAKLLESVEIPTTSLGRSPAAPGLVARWTAAGLEVAVDQPAELVVRDAHGRILAQAGRGTRWSLPLDSRPGLLVLALRWPDGRTLARTVPAP